MQRNIEMRYSSSNLTLFFLSFRYISNLTGVWKCVIAIESMQASCYQLSKLFRKMRCLQKKTGVTKQL